MSTKEKRVCPKLRDACIFAFIVQLFLLAITNLATDGGYIGQICLFAVAGFSSYPISALIFRPKSPTSVDLILIPSGILIVYPLTFFLADFVWDLRGF
jgi:hypothetical protein